jgi:RES domain
MSPPTWTPDALSSEARSYAGSIWRVVEAQHRVSTVRITDTLQEQAILERLIEEVKPPVPPDCRDLHYLLYTPFRYAPYPHGSRFRRARQREGAFYASERVETAIAETAFYRLLFYLEAPAARLPARPTEHTAFRAATATERLIDLTAPPLDRDAAIWRHPVDYGPCQNLADAARAARVEAIRYASVRDPEQQANLALLSPKAFAASAPEVTETWRVFVRRDAVQAWREFPAALRLEFARADFANDPRIAA